MRLMRSRKRKSLAITLVEVMVAMVIACFVSIGFMSSLIMAARSNAQNRLQFYAVQRVAYYQNLSAACNYDKLGDPAVVAADLEFVYKRNTGNPLVEQIQEGPAGAKTPITVWFEFSGWGAVSAISGRTITVTLPTGQQSWVTNVWKDRYVSVSRYAGTKVLVSSFGRILSNTGNSLTYTADLSGVATTAFSPVPAIGDQVLIDNGKTLTIFAKWGDGKGYRQFSRTYLIQQRLD